MMLPGIPQLCHKSIVLNVNHSIQGDSHEAMRRRKDWPRSPQYGLSSHASLCLLAPMMWPVCPATFQRWSDDFIEGGNRVPGGARAAGPISGGRPPSARLLTVAETCRRQRRNMFSCLVDAVEARFAGKLLHLSCLWSLPGQ